MHARADGPWAAGDARNPLTRRLTGMRERLNTAARSWGVDVGEIRRLAEERGALQRVATLVARGVPPAVIFNAAARVLGGLINADYTTINRREADQSMSIVTLWRAAGVPDLTPPVGRRWILGADDASAEALHSHKPARRSSETLRSDFGGWQRKHRIGHVLACPVIVDDRLWGTMTALYLGSEPPPADTEERMGEFVELLNCAIIQAETRTELISARARLVISADKTRGRIEKELHDGAQRRLLALKRRLHEAEANVPPGHQDLEGQLSDALHDLSCVLAQLQELSGGLRSPVLALQGLHAALKDLVSRSPVPVDLDIDIERILPGELEVTLYYVVSEALTNVLKHAHALEIHIDLREVESRIRLTVRDNGVGGADIGQGDGLTGLTDRVEALGGTIHLASPVGEGTTLTVTFP